MALAVASAKAQRNRGGWRGSPASLAALAEHRPTGAELHRRGRPCEVEGCRAAAVEDAGRCVGHGGLLEALNANPTGRIARRLARSRWLERRAPGAGRSLRAAWFALASSSRRDVVIWAGGRWPFPAVVEAATALEAYRSGDGRSWRAFIAKARAEGLLELAPGPIPDASPVEA